LLDVFHLEMGNEPKKPGSGAAAHLEMGNEPRMLRK